MQPILLTILAVCTKHNIIVAATKQRFPQIFKILIILLMLFTKQTPFFKDKIC